MLSIIFALSYDLFFEWIDLTLPIGSELDRVNSAQVGGAIQSKEHSELRIRLAESTISSKKAIVLSYLTYPSVIICMPMTINFSFLLSPLNSAPKCLGPVCPVCPVLRCCVSAGYELILRPVCVLLLLSITKLLTLNNFAKCTTQVHI